MTWILKQAFKVILFAAFVALIVGAVFCGADIIKRYSAESVEIGTVVTPETDETVLATFDFGVDFTFAATTETLERTVDPTSFNGMLNDYVIRLNGKACDTVSVLPGRITATLTMVFYNLDGKPDGNATFNVNIEFASLNTNATFTVTSSSTTVVTYLNQYVFNNGLKFTVNLKEAENG